MEYLTAGNDGAPLLTVYVQPKASHNKIAGLHGDAVKLMITAPPVDGQANKAVINYIAKLFRIPKSQVTLQSGQQSRTKRLRLEGVNLREAEAILNQTLP
ncbi:MAG: DUF167 family protein [Desulfobulbaceae bacterium]|nr:DUF167 family protein [Desulfobulbaceae bacterium]